MARPYVAVIYKRFGIVLEYPNLYKIVATKGPRLVYFLKIFGADYCPISRWPL